MLFANTCDEADAPLDGGGALVSDAGAVGSLALRCRSLSVRLTMCRRMCGLQWPSSQGRTPVVSSEKSFMGRCSKDANISSVMDWNWRRPKKKMLFVHSFY